MRKSADHYQSPLVILLLHMLMYVCELVAAYQRLQGIISPYVRNCKLACECVCVCMCVSPHVFFSLGGSLVELVLALFVSFQILDIGEHRKTNRKHKLSSFL